MTQVTLSSPVRGHSTITLRRATGADILATLAQSNKLGARRQAGLMIGIASLGSEPLGDEGAMLMSREDLDRLWVATDAIIGLSDAADFQPDNPTEYRLLYPAEFNGTTITRIEFPPLSRAQVKKIRRGGSRLASLRRSAACARLPEAPDYTLADVVDILDGMDVVRLMMAYI